MNFVIEDVLSRNGTVKTTEVALNVSRAQNMVPENSTSTRVFYEVDRRKKGAPFVWVVDGAYATIIPNYLDYVPGLSIVLPIEKWDRRVINEDRLLAIDNISHVVADPDDAGKSIIYYEFIGDFELVPLTVAIDFTTLVSILNVGYYS
jgi:hypothetical protein